LPHGHQKHDVQTAIASGGAATLSLTTVEAPKLIMAAARYLENRFLKPLQEKHREEGREQGREEGRDQRDAQWEEWLARRDRAQEEGTPFDELPPSRR
jgi:predicted transposase YdaD